MKYIETINLEGVPVRIPIEVIEEIDAKRKERAQQKKKEQKEWDTHGYQTKDDEIDF